MILNPSDNMYNTSHKLIFIDVTQLITHVSIPLYNQTKDSNYKN